MEDSADIRQGKSGEFLDPYCDPCYEDEGLSVEVRGFCRECVQFLCSDCHAVHRKLHACRHHDVVQGEDMPRSQAEKPPRFEGCDVHPKLLNDQFCCDHKILLCSLCSSSDHDVCSIKRVQDACESVDVSETSALYDKIKILQENLKSALPSVDKGMKRIKEQEKTMLYDTQNIYDRMIAKLNKLFDSIKKHIQMVCQTQIDVLACQQKKISDIVIKLDSPLASLEEVRTKPIDTKVFLRLQDIVGYSRKITTELWESCNSLKFVSLAFVPSQPIQDFLSSSLTFGTIRSSESKSDVVNIIVPEIMFPVSPLKHTGTKHKTEQIAKSQNQVVTETMSLVSKPSNTLSKINATKEGTYDIIQDDAESCWITGMAITKDRSILMTDYTNGKVELFSHDMKFLSTVSVPDLPWDVAMLSDKEAVVTTDNKSLITLDISGSQLNVKSTTQLLFDVRGINRYNNKLVVTSPDSDPPSVKLIDQTGRVYWSVSSDPQRQPLFRLPLYASSHGDGRTTTAVVTDEGNNTLTLLNSDSGEVITRHHLEATYPRGVITDSAGNVYVCCGGSSEVVVLSGNLSQERILLSRQDGLSGTPHAITYDNEAHRLIISYYDYPECDVVDYFQLS